MARDRSTKALASRIELDYFKHPHPWRTAMRNATLAAPILAAVWLLLAVMQGDDIFTSGPVATRHRMFENDCQACHEPWKGVPDTKCVRCHEAPVHHGNQTFTPDCAGCHEEHKGHTRLSRTNDRHCVRCHSDLKTTGQPGGFDSSIQSFNDGHPEFAAVRPGAKDLAVVRYNHLKHMKKGLQGATGPVTLACTGCHFADEAGRYMRPITFEKQCKDCHPLALGLCVPGAVAPHEVPAAVRASVAQQLAVSASQHPERMQPAQSESPTRLRRGTASRPATPVNTAEWIARQAREVERQLFGKTCKLCHDLRPGKGDLQEVVPTKIPVRWMQHATYSHRAHRTLTCSVCHASAARSAETSDVLLPTAVTCLVCHSAAGGSQHGCTECHTYHDKTKERQADGPMEINPVRLIRSGNKREQTGIGAGEF
ncbi:MAG: cytochrome c3 family protein [Candidatus Wallbacteria bacterium]|nr:cytochrome c3 family protein [Candidatus Wallbacteria bacterium]